MDNAVISDFLNHLLGDSRLSTERFFAAIADSKRQKISFISYLLKETLVDSAYLSRELAKKLDLSFVDLDTFDPSQLPIHLLEESLLCKYQVLPLWRDNQTLGLAVIDPTDQEAIDDIQFYSELIVEKILVDPIKLKALREKISIKPILSPKKDSVESVFVSELQNVGLKIVSAELSTLDTHANEMAIIQYVYKLLQSAIARGASDVHIEPYQDKLQIRFRIDGLLYLVVAASMRLTQRIITRFKIMSQLDIAERRLPQDGRFQVKDIDNRTIDCRISTCPMLYGEKLVIRILDSNKRLLEVNTLGMNEWQKTRFLHTLRSPHGMILVTGPTGSGKTITLYTALKFLNTSTANISSVENPIEIVLPGINQVNINPKVGLDFATVLRAFLRQDPDVIMVGEMRDQETAEIGIKAAQTGHLVLSSLHTNNAVESLVRLANMGIPLYNIASSVYLIIAQRLARRLCEHCKVKEKVPQKVLCRLGFNAQEMESISLFSAKGCVKCTEGYRGRIGVFEILAINDEIKSLILQDCDVRAIAIYAENNGMQTLYSSAIEKLKAGEISLLEMKRIIKD